MSDERTIEARIYERLSKVIDPELGRSVTDLGMIAAIDATPVAGETNTYDVRVRVELTVEGCPLSQTITNQINGAVASYPDATLIPSIEVGSMSQDKLTQLVAGLKAERKQNPFNKLGIKPASSPSPLAKAAWANRLSPPIWQPHSRRSATIPPPSTPTSTVSRCPGYSAYNHSPRTSTACSCPSPHGV